MHTANVAALPTVPETPSPRIWDLARIGLWLLAGYAYALIHAPSRRSKLYALSVLLIVTVFPPLLALAVMWDVPVSQRILLTLVCLLIVLPFAGGAVVLRGGRRAYMTPRRDAVLVVRAVESGWRIENFFASRPRKTDTSALWECTVPALQRAADAGGIVVEATAMNTALADYYRRRVPELEVVEVLRSGRIKLERRPRPRS